MTFLGQVDNGPGNRWLRFGGVPDSGGTLTFDLRSQLALIIKHLLCYLWETTGGVPSLMGEELMVEVFVALMLF